MNLKYTICFCLWRDQVLMLRRARRPNQGYWNGVGGKLESGETPRQGITREVFEETTLQLTDADVTFGGLVTWPSTPERSGMFVYLARFPSEFSPPWMERAMEEGFLCWKPLAWVCEPQNTTVVSNIPQFLPRMLSDVAPQEYACDYDGSRFIGLNPIPLSEDIHD